MSYSNLVAENEQLKTQLAAAESQYNQLAAENETLKDHNDNLTSENTELKIQCEAEIKSKTEMFMQYQQEKLEIVTREKQLAEKEADFYRRQVEIASRPAPTTYASSPKMPKIPEFRGSTIGFTRWISWISDLFENYPQLTDFNRRMMVVESLKDDARAWYGAEPDSGTTSWVALKDAILSQYGGTNSIANALQTINSMSLTSHSDFNTFVQKIRPAIQLVAKTDSTLSIAMLRQQVDSEIRR
ncbi:hypothetical protein AYI69_g10249 [Smittium culicis]|uniref:Retrotransposon gag domain-containing protein n=1 Tax=Smittium culicis TaxID=133412 RepID=A0A1R1X751_9FUNG|nr:hypothetical protein AYI69_g10249 [Smittium culicis]